MDEKEQHFTLVTDHQKISGTSKQLLYSEKFDGINREEKLRVTVKRSKDNEQKKTFKHPASTVLSRVQEFLPKLAAANERLQDLPQSEVDIENVEGHKGPLIEMNLALVLGVGSDDDTASDSESDSESSTDSNASENQPEEPLTIHLGNKVRRKRKACIEVVHEESSEVDNR